jgi:histidine ammonia-lyase
LTVHLDGQSLSLSHVVQVARARAPVALADAARRRMAVARAVVDEVIAKNEPAYGLTTGFAERKRVQIDPESRAQFNRLAILNARVGQGDPVPVDVARAAMLCLVNGFGRGTSTARPEIADAVVSALNQGFEPVIRRLGSVGQADFVLMADLANELIEHGFVDPVVGDAVALFDNNSISTGWGALAIADCISLLDTLDAAAALDLEAFGANLSILHPVVADSRGHPGIRQTIDRLREQLDGSSLWATGAARNLQDPLSFRCLPQVHGAMRDALDFAAGIVVTELNSFQGNPAVSVDDRRVVSIANFDALSLAAALDFVRVLLASVLTSANERMLKLLQAPLSGLPSGLSVAPGLAEAGFSEIGVAGQAITVEARTLAHPVSYEMASSTQAEGVEDRTSMASLSARRLAEMVELGERIVTIELVVAAQAVDLRSARTLGRGVQRTRDLVRSCVSFMNEGTPVPQDLEPLRSLVHSGRFISLRSDDR